jgi:hypothetical protein
LSLNTLLDLDFPSVRGKQVSCRFDGGDITTDGGLLLLSCADRRLGLIEAMSDCVNDKRQPSKISHSLCTLFRERVFAIAAGYEDANDLDTLRRDPALKLSCGLTPKSDGDLGSQPTLSRLENAMTRKDLLRMGVALARRVVGSLPSGTKRVVLDLDAMEDPCHGQQELEFFNAFYDSHCYLPLLLFVTDEEGRQYLMGVLLRSGKPGNKGVSGIITRAVGLLRERFADLEIVFRADAGFGHDANLRLCDTLGIKYVMGLSGNRRLHALSTNVQMQACCKYTFHKEDWWEQGACREFTTMEYKAGSWDKKRTIVVKAEITQGQLNPRFVVTNLTSDAPEELYTFYCARGDRENRIKEFKLDLAGGRTSCHRFLANQFRVILHTAAAVLMGELQKAAEKTRWKKAQAATLRLRILKVGARVVESVRRVWMHLSSSYPDKEAWSTIYEELRT